MPKNMRAAFIRRYGDNDALCVGPREVPGVSPREVLIEVHAAAVNPRDWMLREGTYPFRHLVVGFPKHLGSDVAGTVKRIGAEVRGLQLGDEVVAMQTTLGQMGGFAVYMCVNASAVARKAACMSFEQGAGLGVAGLTALQALRDEAGLRRGERVAVIGASGGVGHYGVQIAKAMGAEVHAVCGPRSVAHVRELGATHIFDYSCEDFTDCEDSNYDLILAINGHHSPRAYERSLAAGGCLVVVGGTNRQIFEGLLLAPLVFLGSGKRVCTLNVDEGRRSSDLAQLCEMLGSEQLRPLIDRSFPLAQAAEAMRYVEAGHVRGKVVLTS